MWIKRVIFNSMHFFASLEITEFQADKAMQGFTHENGRLKVQKCGFYYVYSQVFFQPHSSATQNRVALSVNGAAFGLMQAGLGGSAGYGTLFTAGVIHLHEGDYISLKTHYVSNLWVSRAHTFFGAYRIGE